MSEYWFYHLEASSLQGVLPDLLEKTRARGWKALVKLPEEQLGDMDDYLWTYQDDSFLPHGRDDQPQSDQQPIILTASSENSSGYECVFLVDGQAMTIAPETERCIVMINGRNESDVKQARAFWKQLKDESAELSYWQQTDNGRWEKKA